MTKSNLKLEQLLNERCQTKVKTLENCEEERSTCGCSPGGGSGEDMVDLVVLIDSSGSMSTKAKNVSDAADNAINKAKEKCPSDVRITWLTVDFVKPGSASISNWYTTNTKFTHSHQKYLEGIGAPGPFYHDSANVPSTAGDYPSEQGANAISDVSEFFDWREGTCRSIFYISDTALEGERSTIASNDSAVSQAIAVANTNNVTVFAHRVEPHSRAGLPGSLTDALINQDYQNLCNSTGGEATLTGIGDENQYEELLEKTICKACRGCKNVDFPDIKPCISISWGDGEHDCFETDDFEILCITVCNCYSNVTFNNLTMGLIEVCDKEGNSVPNLPDGTPSVQVIPIGPLCFGDVKACVEGEETCVSRELAIRTCGALEGDYQIKLGNICYEIVQVFEEEACFKFELTKS